MHDLRELLAEKTLKLLEAGEDFEDGRITFMRYMATVKELATEISTLLDKWAFVDRQ